MFTVILLCALGLSWFLRHVLQILYVSALFAVVLTPVVKRIQRLRVKNYHPNEAVAVLLMIAAIATALGLFCWIGLPPVLSDFSSFVSDLPKHIPEVLGKIRHLPLANKFDLSKIAAAAQNALGAAVAYVFAALPQWAAHLLDVLTAFILCVYFILEGAEVYRFFLSLVPIDERNRLANTILAAEERVSKWLLGQLALMGIVAVYSLVVFGALHLRYFVMFGILMGITNIIPVAGNLITMAMVLMVAASDSWSKALFVLLAYLVYVQIENAFLTPRIMKTSVDLMGVTVLVALLVGTAIAGIVGALVAVPTAAMVVVFANEYLVQRDNLE